MNLGRLVVSSTAAATPRQLVDKVVEEDRRMLLANELESTTLPDRTTQVLGPAAQEALAIFEDLCRWVTKCVRNSYNSSTSTRPLLSS
jgi:hypothetical protein